MSSLDDRYPGIRRGPRGTIDIIADILSLCSTSTGKTNIMYKANLSHQMLKFYLWHLVALGLLEESDSKFKVSQKGEAFLLFYQKIAGLLEGLDTTGSDRHFLSQQHRVNNLSEREG